MNRACLAVVLVFIAIACGSQEKTTLPSPTAPTPALSTAPAAPTPALSTLLILGPVPTVGPGETAQVKAVARYTDGSERDVSADATWTSSQPQIATVEGGIIKGQALGRTQLRALYMSRSAFSTIVIEPGGTFILSGSITEPGPATVETATVAVLGGPPNSVTARSGFFELFGVAGTVTVRVSSPGYLDETRMLTVTQNQRLDVEIRPMVAPPSIAGTYGLTVRMSPSCSIVPEDQKTRTYTATIGQNNARLTVQLSDANFDHNYNSLSGKVSGNTVTFDWGSGFYDSFYGGTVQEILPGGKILGIWGTTVAPAAQTMSGKLVGGFTLNSGGGCSAVDSDVIFTRK